MVWHRQGRDFTGFNHDDMTRFLPHDLPAEFLKNSNDFPTAQDRNQGCHQIVTSTWPVSTVNGNPLSARTSKQSLIAFLMFFIASRFVRP
jgi:hypothetical protein